MTTTMGERRCARLLRILERLQTGSLMTARQLAEDVDVCPRTIYRDLKTLRSAGMRISFERPLRAQEPGSGQSAEAGGAYRLVPRAGLTVVPRLEPDELLMLSMAAHLSSLTQLPGCGQRLRQAAGKLTAEAPDEFGRGLQRLLQTIDADCSLAQYSRYALQTLDQVIQAIHGRRTLVMTLQDPGAVTTEQTRLALYRVDVTPHGWMLTGRSSLHGCVTQIDPRHVRSAQLTDEIYAVPRRYQAV